MTQRSILIVGMVALAGMLIFAGCSSDEPTGTTTATTTLEMVDVAQVIRNVTPPVYVAPTSAPAIDSFEVWTQGEWPLLETVFGSNEPQSLEQNIYEFGFFTGAIKDIIQLDANGDVITGDYIDSVVRVEQGLDTTFHGTFTVSELTAQTTIPTACQEILGTTYDLDYLIDISIDEIPDGNVKVGFKIDSTEQILVVYLTDMSGEPGRTESSISYSSLNLADSTFIFKGVMYTTNPYGIFSTAYVISSVTEGEFGYRSGWVSDESGQEYNMRGGIVGGGDKDVEFALKYRQWVPFDTTVADPNFTFDQVFGPNYTEGTGLISAYEEYTNDSLFIDLDLIPDAVVADPWAE